MLGSSRAIDWCKASSYLDINTQVMNYFQVCDPTVGRFNSTKAALHEILNNLFRFQTELQVNGDVETFYRRRHAERRAGEWMNDYETKRKTDGDDATFPTFFAFTT